MVPLILQLKEYLWRNNLRPGAENLQNVFLCEKGFCGQDSYELGEQIVFDYNQKINSKSN